jgi:quercetin dioxygenase-like cupin family protein
MTPPDRLRPHPSERFSDPAQLIDLNETSARLRAEPHAAIGGHRQISVFHHGPVTLVLFVIEPGGLLREHRAEGVVTIHALSGRLVVVVDDDDLHELVAGQLLALAPGISHSVRATVASEVLLTVHKTDGVLAE